MKLLNIIEKILYLLVLVGIFIATLDSNNRFIIRKKLVLFFCQNEAPCRLKVMNYYGYFHDTGTLAYLLFEQSKIAFVVGQIITLFIYWSLIWFVMKMCKKLLLIIKSRK